MGRQGCGVPGLDERNNPSGLEGKLWWATSHRPNYQDKPGVCRLKDPCSLAQQFTITFRLASCATYQKCVRVSGTVRRETESRMYPFHITEITPLP